MRASPKSGSAGVCRDKLLESNLTRLPANKLTSKNRQYVCGIVAPAGAEGGVVFDAGDFDKVCIISV